MEMNATTVIHRPINTVFAYVSDVSNDVRWRSGVTESGLHSDEPLAPGATGYSRSGQGETTWRLTSYVPGESMDWELVSGPFKGCGGYRLVPMGTGTQFTLVAEIEPTGINKLMGPLFTWLGRRRNQADVEKLRELLESSGD